MATTTSTSPTSDLTTPGGGFVSTDPAVRARLAEMQQQVLASATPQAAASERLRLAGAATAQQADQMRTPGTSAYDAISRMISSPSSGSAVTSEPYRNRIEDATQQVASRVTTPLSGTSAGQNTNLNQTVQGADQFNRDSVDEDPLFKLIGQRREQLREENQRLTDSIRANFENRLTATKEDQRAETGMNAMALARGGALGTSGSGLAFMNKLEISHRSEINALETQRNDALRLAAQAASKEDFELLGKQIDRADKLEKEFNDAQQRRVDNLLKYKQIEKIEKEELSETLSALAAAGQTLDDLPDGYLDFQERASGLPAGTGRFVFEASQKEQALKAKKDDLAMRKDEAALQRETYDIASQIVDIQAKVPRGQPIKIGDATYYGMGTGHLKSGVEVDKSGETVYYEFDPYTKKMTTYKTGIHRQQDGDELVFDGQGRPFWANKYTKSLEYAGKPTQWQQIIPEGSDGGQCGTFFRTVTGIADPKTGLIPNDLEGKIRLTDPTLTPDKLQVGDGFVSDEGGWSGHIGLINTITDVDGRKLLTLTESNRNLDEKVTHTKQIWADDPRFKGFIMSRGKIAPAFRTGTDAPTPGSVTFAPKVTAEDKAPVTKEINGVTHQWNATTKGWDPIVSSGPQPTTDPRVLKLKDSVKTDFQELLGMQNQIQTLKDLKANQDTGPLAAMTNKARAQVNMANPTLLDMNATAEDLRSLIMKSRSGSAVSESEVKRLATFLPSVSDNDQLFNSKLKTLETKYNAMMDFHAKSYGFKDAADFRSALGIGMAVDTERVANSSSISKIQGPDGTPYEYDLSKPDQKAEYDQALAAGWKPL